jgi:hypothetical protein
MRRARMMIMEINGKAMLDHHRPSPHARKVRPDPQGGLSNRMRKPVRFTHRCSPKVICRNERHKKAIPYSDAGFMRR